MASRPKTTAHIDIWHSHWATLEPLFPAIAERLQRLIVEFEVGGPQGHTMKLVRSDQYVGTTWRKWYDEAIGRYGRAKAQVLPQGLVPIVRTWLQDEGIDVTVTDHRSDSPRWLRADDHFLRARTAKRLAIDALDQHRCLRMIVDGDEDAASMILAVARSYPSARIGIAFSTYKQTWRFKWRIESRLEEPVGLFTARKRRPQRVSVGVLSQFPRGNAGEFDLIILPYGERTVGDNALERLTSAQYRRILSFTRRRWTRDESVNWRLEVISGSVWPPEHVKPPVTAVLLSTYGSQPDGMADAHEVKRQLYWCNARRNRRLAELASRLATGSLKTIRSVIGAGPLLEPIVAASESGVTILVETPVHGRELAALLPGWAVHQKTDLIVPRPQVGCGLILTELAAAEMFIRAGILIRATGTRWPLPDLRWPLVECVDHGILIDLKDRYHPLAASNAQERIESYAQEGLTLAEIVPVARKEHVKTPGPA